jgi:hypothetical protein
MEPSRGYVSHAFPPGNHRCHRRSAFVDRVPSSGGRAGRQGQLNGGPPSPRTVVRRRMVCTAVRSACGIGPPQDPAPCCRDQFLRTPHREQIQLVACGATADRRAHRFQHARRRRRAGIRPVLDVGSPTPRQVHAPPTAAWDGSHATSAAARCRATVRVRTRRVRCLMGCHCSVDVAGGSAGGAHMNEVPFGTAATGAVGSFRRSGRCRWVPCHWGGGGNRKRHGLAARPHAIPFHLGQRIDLLRLVVPCGAGIGHGGGRARATGDHLDRARAIGTDVRVVPMRASRERRVESAPRSRGTGVGCAASAPRGSSTLGSWPSRSSSQ